MEETCLATVRLAVMEKSAGEVFRWLSEGRGVLFWKSVSMSDPDRIWLTPAVDCNGKDYQPPHWAAERSPSERFDSLDDVEVILPKLVKRFPVSIRQSQFGLKLTDKSSWKLRRELERAAKSSLYNKSWYEFDYSTQEALIFVHAGWNVPLKEWAEKNVPKQEANQEEEKDGIPQA